MKLNNPVTKILVDKLVNIKQMDLKFSFEGEKDCILEREALYDMAISLQVFEESKIEKLNRSLSNL